MALIYITGVAGTGKSTICQQLRQLGYTAYDADVDGFMGWQHIASGEWVCGYDMPNYLSKSWFEEYQWALSRVRVEQAALEAANKPVFICGTSANDEDVHDLLHHVMFLTLDEQILRQRLATRDTNSFGKTEDELNHVLRWIQPAEEYYRNFGAFMLNAAEPVEHVVSQILHVIQPTEDYSFA
jgi:shikimate kinase